MLQSKILRAMREIDKAYVLQGAQIDDVYSSWKPPGGKPGPNSENKVPIVAAISLNAAGQPIHAKSSPLAEFTWETLGD